MERKAINVYVASSVERGIHCEEVSTAMKKVENERMVYQTAYQMIYQQIFKVRLKKKRPCHAIQLISIFLYSRQ